MPGNRLQKTAVDGCILKRKVGDLAEIELLPTVETSEICIQDMRKASNDDDCVGVITWMHTFSLQKCGSKVCRN